jgi:hypothetical protein
MPNAYTSLPNHSKVKGKTDDNLNCLPQKKLIADFGNMKQYSKNNKGCLPNLDEYKGTVSKFKDMVFLY